MGRWMGGLANEGNRPHGELVGGLDMRNEWEG